MQKIQDEVKKMENTSHPILRDGVFSLFPVLFQFIPRSVDFSPPLKRADPGTDFASVSHESVFNFNKLRLLKAVARKLLFLLTKGEGTQWGRWT